MPFTLTRNFRVRFYECDAHGHMNNANYLRYMQEAAFDASAATGYTLARYQEMQRLWLIRESGIEFLRPLFYNDVVAVKTWVADFRRVTSRRAYEFSLAETGALAARAYTDWAFIDTQANRPAKIPSELHQAFFPEGLPAETPPRQPFLKAPPPPTSSFKMRREVAFLDIDTMQHVNNAVYLNYVSECSVQALASYGWPWERMQAQGFGIFLRKIVIQYLQPALWGDELEIATWASNVRRATANRHYTIRRARDDELLAQAYSMGVWVNLQNGEPIRIPKDFLADLSPNIA